jgi:hypoxanthine-guanine phosphoribosyltransferase
VESACASRVAKQMRIAEMATRAKKMASVCRDKDVLLCHSVLDTESKVILCIREDATLSTTIVRLLTKTKFLL